MSDDQRASVQQEDEHEPWEDSPLQAAKRRAFDRPTIENLEALIVSARSGWRPPEPAEPIDPRCQRDVGKRPYWMGVDQYDPCRCRLDTGHEGPHWCEHLDEPDPRLAVPVSAPEAGETP